MPTTKVKQTIAVLVFSWRPGRDDQAGFACWFAGLQKAFKLKQIEIKKIKNGKFTFYVGVFYFSLLALKFSIFDLKFGFLVKSCMYGQILDKNHENPEINKTSTFYVFGMEIF